jgi:hypothetical protein
VRDYKAEIRAIHARGEKLPSEVFSSMLRCVCGVRFDSWKPEESYDHCAHIYAPKHKTEHGQVCEPFSTVPAREHRVNTESSQPVENFTLAVAGGGISLRTNLPAIGVAVR